MPSVARDIKNVQRNVYAGGFGQLSFGFFQYAFNFSVMFALDMNMWDSQMTNIANTTFY